MFHCYTTPSSTSPPSCRRNSSHSSLISLVRTRSNYSTVLTMGLPCVRDHSLKRFWRFHKRKKGEKRKQLFRFQSMDEVKEGKVVNAMRGAVEEGMCRMVRSVSIDVPLMERLENEEGNRVLRAYFGGVLILSSLPGNHPPELSAPQKELPDSSEPDTSPGRCIKPSDVHQSSSWHHSHSDSDFIDLSLDETGTRTGENYDKGKNDDVVNGGEMPVTDDSCDLENEEKTEKMKNGKLKKLLFICCVKGIEDN